jgi:hypothetical protein
MAFDPSKLQRQNFSGNGTENFPLQVASYGKDPDGKDYVLGQRLDTQQQVKVILRNYTPNPGSEYSRPEVADFKAEAGQIQNLVQALQQAGQNTSGVKNKTEPGGVIMVERAYEKDGRYHAFWMRSLKRYPADDREVFASSMYRLNPPSQRTDRQTGEVSKIAPSVTWVFPHDATAHTSFDTLIDKLKSDLGSNWDQGHAVALLRAYENGTGSAEAIEFRATSRWDGQAQKFVRPDTNEMIDKWAASEIGQYIKAEMAENPALVMESMYGIHMSFAKAGRESVEKQLKHYLLQHQVKEFGENQPVQMGFVNGTVTVGYGTSEGGERIAYLTNITPGLRDTSPVLAKHFTTASVQPTTDYVPVAPPKPQAQQAQPAETAQTPAAEPQQTQRQQRNQAGAAQSPATTAAPAAAATTQHDQYAHIQEPNPVVPDFDGLPDDGLTFGEFDMADALFAPPPRP